jgi:hypothetical protein
MASVAEQLEDQYQVQMMGKENSNLPEYHRTAFQP